jgi:hypothetical protein
VARLRRRRPPRLHDGPTASDALRDRRKYTGLEPKQWPLEYHPAGGGESGRDHDAADEVHGRRMQVQNRPAPRAMFTDSMCSMYMP